MKTKTPTSVGLYATLRCNQLCSFCSYKNIVGRPRTDMSVETARVVLGMFPHIEMVGITGGEPLLCRDLWGIVELVKSKRLELNIATNATLLKEPNPLLEDVLVVVSAKATGREEYAELAGVDHFGRMLLGVKSAQESGANVGVSFVIDKMNIHRLVEYAEFAKSIGVRRLAFMSLFSGGREELAPRIIRQPDMGVVEKQRETIEKMKLDVRQWPKPLNPRAKGRGCRMAENYVAVDHRGSIALCCRGPGPRPEMGNVLEGGPTVWSSGEMAKLRARVFSGNDQPRKCLLCRENWG